MKQPHRLDDSFRVPRPVRSGRSENAPAVVVVLSVLVSLGLLAILLVEVARIIIEGMHR